MPFHKSAARAAQPQPPPSLPPKFTEIRAVLDEQVSPGRIINVIGLVKDCRLPIPTSGTDHKCTLKLYDVSTEDGQDDLTFVIFRPEAEMPQVSAGDVLVIHSVRVQRYQANPLSIITNRTTSIRVYAASGIPRPPQPAQVALKPGSSRDKYAPSPQEHAYVSHLYHTIDRYFIPDEHEFQERAAQSLNVKTKFSLLKDVQDGKFCDLIVQVAAEPYAGSLMTTLYVSDYTENPHFHPQAWEGLSEWMPAGGDPYGYTSSSTPMPKKEWVGPYGKMTIQISCFEPHATVVRDEVKAGQWIGLRNVQIKYGHDGKYLEGFLREARNDASNKVNVLLLETHDRETIDPHLKEAIRRCRDYTRKKKQEIKAIKSAEAAGQKRKASRSEEPEKRPPNAKERRKQARAAAERKEKETFINEELRLGLNDQVICEAHNEAFSTVESILAPASYERSLDGRDVNLLMPFICAKYKARVRVVDFFPPTLEDFACSRTQTDFDVLSDADGSDCPSSSSEDEDAPGADRVWEWRFALQLEDSGAPSTNTKGNKTDQQSQSRLWVIVDNQEAQCLTGLDATDLRGDAETLAQLRERMFILWGDLEEHKARTESLMKPREETGRGKRQTRQSRPPLHSSDPESEQTGGVDIAAVSNKPFTCCIQQYGVPARREGEAGWVRCFGLFGIKVCA